VRSMSTDFGISSIIVIGGSGAYFDVADCVVMMNGTTRRTAVRLKGRTDLSFPAAYRPVDVTAKAMQIVENQKGVSDAVLLPFYSFLLSRPLYNSSGST
jgi:predicted ABC-class ATPase